MTPYATTAEVRQQVGKKEPNDDPLMEQLIAAAQQCIDGLCNRPDGFVAAAVVTARLFAGSGQLTLRIGECVEVTLVESKHPAGTLWSAWPVGHWLAFSGDPRDPDFDRLPYTQIMAAPVSAYASFPSGRYGSAAYPTVRVTARWGYAPTVPDVIRQATITQVARWYKRGQSAWADTLANEDLGLLSYRKVMDPDVVLMLEKARFIRPTVG